MRGGRRAALAITLLMVGPAAAGPEPAPVLPLSEIVPGQRGVVRTVLRGDTPQDVPLEILGVAPSFAGPGRDVILARLEGEAAERSGVAAGMSGSPVLVGGRLVGALAYRLSAFSKEALAGITPIEQMLAIPQDEVETPSPAESSVRYPMAALLGLAAWPEGTASELPAATPVVVAGVDESVRERFGPILAASGLGPMLAAGGSLEGGNGRHGLEAGEAVSAVLVGGDLTVAATGTVTLVEGDRLWALGHPLVRLGPVDLPMARSSVLLTVPSLAGSFKLVRVGEIVGAFQQDRAAGLFGRLGATAQLLSVGVRVRSASSSQGASFRFEVARLRDLSPPLLELAVANALVAADRGALASGIRMKGTIRIDRSGELPVDNVFAGGTAVLPAPIRAARHVAGLLAALDGLPGGWGRATHVDLDCEIESPPRQLNLEEAWMDRETAAPGGTVWLTARLRDRFTGAVRFERLSSPVPALPRGARLDVLVGDAVSIAAADGGALLGAITAATDVDGLIRALSRIPSSDRLYLRVGRAAPGLVAGADPMPDLPPSIRAVLAATGSSRVPPATKEAVVHLTDRALGVAVSGQARLSFTVE